MQDSRRLYQALATRDARFDGVFYVGVTSTRIYCRPICPAKTPKRGNCRFFATPQQAEVAGFRPCLRCRPELAPGSAPVDDGPRIAQLIVERLEQGHFDDRAGLDDIADQFELSARQIRRIVRKELGVPPIQLLLTRRLLLAKQLLTETALPVTEVAFASGFASLRRFNDAFRRRYGMPPTALRRQAAGDAAPLVTGEVCTLQMAYRPPYDWEGTLGFLAARALRGVEHVTDRAYARTAAIGGASGWIRVTRSQAEHRLALEFSQGLTAVLPALIARVRALFDLDARPDLIARQLQKDPRLAPSVRAHPGRRVPGAFDGFELAVRAVLGQQISVRAATTLAARFVEAFGTPAVTPCPELTRFTPTPDCIAAARLRDIVRHGVLPARAASLIALAEATASEQVCLVGGTCPRPQDAIARLTALPGIGPWTAQYIAMRALRWPDAFPAGDLAIRRGLGGVTAQQAEAMSHAWSPWRSYAVMHVWSLPRTPRPRPAAAARRDGHAFASPGRHV